MNNSSRLRWQCRRGMRELDVLLERYLCDGHEESNQLEKDAFGQLLALSDPELASYLLRGEHHQDSVKSNVIARILDRTDS